MDKRQGRFFTGFCPKILLIVPGIDDMRVGVRRILEAAALPLFLREADTVGKKVIVAHLRICRRLDTPLPVHNIVDIVKPMISFIL